MLTQHYFDKNKNTGRKVVNKHEKYIFYYSVINITKTLKIEKYSFGREIILRKISQLFIVGLNRDVSKCRIEQSPRTRDTNLSDKSCKTKFGAIGSLRVI